MTPNQIEKRKDSNKKILKYGCLSVFALVVLIGVLGSLSNNDDTGKSNVTNDKSHSAKETLNKVSQIIPGLAPVDIYLNMEKQGFKTEKSFSSEYGNSWISKSKVHGIDFEVSVFSMDSENVETVRATAMIDPSQENIRAEKVSCTFRELGIP